VSRPERFGKEGANMWIAIGLLVYGVAAFVAGFLVCHKNYEWTKNVEADAVAKAKDAVNKL
jgi:hypothetical protein